MAASKLEVPIFQFVDEIEITSQQLHQKFQSPAIQLIADRRKWKCEVQDGGPPTSTLASTGGWVGGWAGGRTDGWMDGEQFNLLCFYPACSIRALAIYVDELLQPKMVHDIWNLPTLAVFSVVDTRG